VDDRVTNKLIENIEQLYKQVGMIADILEEMRVRIEKLEAEDGN